MFEKKGFSSEDICRILKACKEAGVLEFNFGGLIVGFKPEAPSQASEAYPEKNSESKPFIENKISREDFESEKIANMQLENPAEYEKLLLAEDLVDAQS